MAMTIEELVEKFCNILYGEKSMVQTKMLKITAEVDGKIVPLNTISTESFEAIKALEKPKEIPVARLADHYGNKRLILRIDNAFREKIALHKDASEIAINLTTGRIEHWSDMYIYKDIESL